MFAMGYWMHRRRPYGKSLHVTRNTHVNTCENRVLTCFKHVKTLFSHEYFVSHVSFFRKGEAIRLQASQLTATARIFLRPTTFNHSSIQRNLDFYIEIKRGSKMVRAYGTHIMTSQKSENACADYPVKPTHTNQNLSRYVTCPQSTLPKHYYPIPILDSTS